VRNLLSKGRIIKCGETILFDMPCLERSYPGQARTDEETLLYAAQRAEAVEREAYERGFTAGEKAGFEMGEQKAAVLLGRLENLLREIGVMKATLVTEIEPQITDLAVGIAKKIIMEELKTDPGIIVNVVKEAIRKIERTGTITIKLNPGLYDLFTRKKPELLEVHPDIVYEVDPSVPATGPLVIGEKEAVITDIDSQLKNIAEDIEGGRGEH
jgi:flagellar assembly protein FliH